MIIKYGKVTLRAVEFEDLDMLREMMNDPDIEHFVGGYSYPVSKTQQEEWFNNIKNQKDELRLIVDTKEYGAIGTVTLSNINWKKRTAESNLKLENKMELRGHGFGTYALAAILKYAFNQMNIHCVYGNVVTYNEISKRLQKKLGYRFDGRFRDYIYRDGEYYDLEIWSIKKGELIEPRDR